MRLRRSMSKRPIDEAGEPHASAKQAKPSTEETEETKETKEIREGVPPSVDAGSLTMWIEAWIKTNVCSKLNLAGLEITEFLDDVRSNMAEMVDFDEFLGELKHDHRIEISSPGAETALHEKLVSAVSDYVHGHVLTEFMSNVFQTHIVNKKAATELCESMDQDGSIDKFQFNVLYTIAEEILSGGTEVEDSDEDEPADESDPEENSESEESPSGSSGSSGSSEEDSEEDSDE